MKIIQGVVYLIVFTIVTLGALAFSGFVLRQLLEAFKMGWNL